MGNRCWSHCAVNRLHAWSRSLRRRRRSALVHSKAGWKSRETLSARTWTKAFSSSELSAGHARLDLEPGKSGALGKRSATQIGQRRRAAFYFSDLNLRNRAPALCWLVASEASLRRMKDALYWAPPCSNDSFDARNRGRSLQFEWPFSQRPYRSFTGRDGATRPADAHYG